MARQIIAVDFDGTLCQNKYPNIGSPNDWAIDWVKERQQQGDIIILWTCREGRDLDKAIGWCNQHALRFDYINENAPANIAEFGNNCRKIYADIYLDDKALNVRDLP